MHRLAPTILRRHAEWLRINPSFIHPCSSHRLSHLLYGPDQIVPSDEPYTVKPDGAVRIMRKSWNRLANLPPISVPGFLHLAATRYPDTLALVFTREDGTRGEITYPRYEDLVRTVAKGFIKLGLKRFHSVCILGHNSPQWAISDMAAIYAGGFATGIYTTSTPDACHYFAATSRANIIVAEDEEQVEKILEVKDSLPDLQAIVQYSGVPKATGVISWNELKAIGSEESDQVLDKGLTSISTNECCTLIFTSGTTGTPKAVMLSHDNMTWTARVVAEAFSGYFGNERVVSYLPLSHVAAQIIDLYVMVAVGGTTYFADKDALKGTVVKTMREVHPTTFLGVPRVWEKINEQLILKTGQADGAKKELIEWAKKVGLENNMKLMNKQPAGSAQYTLANILVFNRIKKQVGLDQCKRFLNGAAPLPKDVKLSNWSFDLRVVEAFGMSETGGCQTLNITTDFQLESIGRTLPGCYTMIDEPDEHNEGEIMLKGRNIFMGYLNDLPKTQEAFDKDGWFRTGDKGWIDNSGFVYITGRLKEIIITAGGENVPPVLIEDNIKAELPCISHAVLIGNQRKYLTVLLTLNTEISQDTGLPRDQLSEIARLWCENIGCSLTTVSDIINNKDERVFTAIKEGIDRANLRSTMSAYRVQKFALLQKGFSIPTEEIGPTLKLKRDVITAKYADAIENLYKQ